MDFLCTCDFCQKDDENENDFAFYEKFAKIYKEAENLKIDRINTFQSVSNCRKEVDLYKELYKISREKNIPPTALSEILQRGFDASNTGYEICKEEFKDCHFKVYLIIEEEFKNDCKHFAMISEKYISE